MTRLGGMSLLAVAVGVPAVAQEAQAPTERTGQQAVVPVPEFEEPAEFPSVEPSAQSTFPEVSGTARISGVEVEPSGSTFGKARPDFGWLDDPTYGLRVLAGPGETLDPAWVRRQFSANNLVGEAVAIERLVALVQLINRAFVANGFINTGVLINGPVPEDGGALRTRLIVGKLVGEGNRLILQWGEGGPKGLSEEFVANRMSSAREAPLDVIAIERDFRLLAENPAIQSVSADLQPGAIAGEARLVMAVRPADRADLYMGYANSRSPTIGGERFSLGGSFRNLLSPGDIISAEGGLTSGEPDANFGYSTPLGGPDTTLRLLGGFNEAAVVDPQLRPLDISASDWNVEGGVTRRLFSRPLTPRRDGDGWESARSFSVGLSVAHRVSKTRLLGRPFSFSPGADNGRAEYTAARIAADFVQRGINTVLVVALTGTQGIDGSRGDIPGLTTPDSDFRTINAQVSYARLLSDDGLELRMRLAGQYADGILYSGERFAAGGRQTVRGYRETLVLSDLGAIGSIELAQPFTLSGRDAARRSFDWGAFSASAFVDGAVLGNREVADPITDTLLSLGAGLEWRPTPALSARFIYAEALKDAVAPGRRDLQDRGFHFALTLRPLELFR